MGGFLWKGTGCAFLLLLSHMSHTYELSLASFRPLFVRYEAQAKSASRQDVFDADCSRIVRFRCAEMAWAGRAPNSRDCRSLEGWRCRLLSQNIIANAGCVNEWVAAAVYHTFRVSPVLHCGCAVLRAGKSSVERRFCTGCTARPCFMQRHERFLGLPGGHDATTVARRMGDRTQIFEVMFGLCCLWRYLLCIARNRKGD